MGDWLGTGTVSTNLRRFQPFRKARTFARSLNLKSRAEWSAFIRAGKLPFEIPSNPNFTYVDEGWNGWGDWLGSGRIATHKRSHRPFAQARAYAQSLKLKSGAEWNAFTKSGKLPADIPMNPAGVYADEGWGGMGDWLGTGTVANMRREFRSFKQSRAFARSLKLKNQTEWIAFTKSGKLPPDVPAAPYRTYKDKGWIGVGDWLGTGTIAPRLRQYRPFLKARAFARGLRLKSSTEWRSFAKSDKLPDDIPADPRNAYRDKGWTGMRDWLGTG